MFLALNSQTTEKFVLCYEKKNPGYIHTLKNDLDNNEGLVFIYSEALKITK